MSNSIKFKVERKIQSADDFTVDDCWQSKDRDPKTGQIVADPKKFPNGMKAVTDKIHSLGLRAGIYATGGTKTCAGFPGSLNHEAKDAETFAAWGFDALKYDNCFHQGQSGTEEKSASRLNKMSDAVASTGRSMILALCNWGQDKPWNWAGKHWNS